MKRWRFLLIVLLVLGVCALLIWSRNDSLSDVTVEWVDDAWTASVGSTGYFTRTARARNGETERLYVVDEKWVRQPNIEMALLMIDRGGGDHMDSRRGQL
jgi:hypothetical protein